MSILGFLEIGEIGINGYRHQCSVLKQELIFFFFFGIERQLEKNF